MLTGCVTSGGKLPALDTSYSKCFADRVGKPGPGNISKSQAFNIIASLKHSELKKSRCGQRLIALYNSLR